MSRTTGFWVTTADQADVAHDAFLLVKFDLAIIKEKRFRFDAAELGRTTRGNGYLPHPKWPDAIALIRPTVGDQVRRFVAFLTEDFH